MTIQHFDRSLLIEQIRYIETSHALDCDYAEEFSTSTTHPDFHERLWLRAKCLVRQHDLSAVIAHAPRLSRMIKFISLILVALFGAMGTVYAITDSNTINIYWLLLVLLGFNFISMLLWLTGISLNMQSLSSGLLSRLSIWLTGIFDNRTNTVSQQNPDITNLAGRAWLNCNFSAAVGKWQLSKITHQLWLVYLLSGLAILLLLLMVKQYDFVWGTTLLSDSVFIRVTQILSRPLEMIGLTSLTADQVQQSRAGLDPVLAAAHRASWAQFLLGALIGFGILPRAVLLLWSSLMSHRARRRFRLDLYLPYYISLRQAIMPMASHARVVDADAFAPQSVAATHQSPVSQALPQHTKWVAVELGSNFAWPLSSINQKNNLGEVIDRPTLASTVQLLQGSDCAELAVAVAVARSPDRGVQRTISRLMSHCKTRWLVLLQSPDEATISSKRLAHWYRLAEACDIPADHVISMSVN